MKNLFRFLMACMFISANSFAGNYTWTGTTSSSWAVSTNWSPNGIPGSTDSITINTTSTNLVLTTKQTVKRLTINSDTLDLGGDTLEITGSAAFSGGKINNGVCYPQCTGLLNFNSTTFGAEVKAKGQIKLNGCTFNNTAYFEHVGSAAGTGTGGNTFNGTTTLKNTGTSTLRIGQINNDVFNGNAYMISVSNNIQISYGAHTYFNENVEFTSSTIYGINVGGTGNGYTYLAAGKTITSGGTGIIGSFLLRNFIQYGTTAQSFTSSGSLNMTTCIFNGNLTCSAQALLLSGNEFHGTTNLTKTGTSSDFSAGGNRFFNSVTFTNNASNTASLRLASTNGDIFDGDVTLNTNTGQIQIAYGDTTDFKGHITSNNSAKVTFGRGGGYANFNGLNEQILSGTGEFLFSRMIVNKTTSTVTLQKPIKVDSLLVLHQGLIKGDSTNKVTIGTLGVVQEGSVQSFVDGAIQKIGNTAFIFPVGDNNRFLPLSISAPSNSTDAFTCQAISGKTGYNLILDSTLMLPDTCSYWNLYRNVGSSNVYVTLTLDASSCLYSDSLNYRVATWNGSSWSDIGNGLSTNTTVKSNVVSANYSSFLVGLNRIANTCSNLIEIDADTAFINNTFALTDSVMWFKFVADSTSTLIHIKNYELINPAKLKSFNVYSGNCGSLTQVDSVQTFVPEDSSASVLITTMPYNTYYIKLEGILSFNQSTQLFNGNLDIAVKNGGFFSIVPCFDENGCGLGYNMGLNQLQSPNWQPHWSEPFYPPHHWYASCYWLSANKSPQLGNTLPACPNSASGDIIHAVLYSMNESESIFQPINFNQNETYILRYFYRLPPNLITTYPGYTVVNHVDQLDVYLGDNIPINNTPYSSSLYPGKWGNTMLVDQVANVNSNVWQSRASWFVPTMNYTGIAIIPRQNVLGELSVMHVDNFYIYRLVANAGIDGNICLGESLKLGDMSQNCATSGETYSWNPTTGLSASNILEPIFTPTNPGVYTFTLRVTDPSTGHYVEDLVTITVNQINISPQNTSICANTPTLVTLNPTGGTSPYSYILNNVATSNPITVNTSGIYSVTVTDNIGCSTTSSITITNFFLHANLIATPSYSVCQSGSGATLTATVTVGDGPFTYLWSNGATTNSIFVNAASTYFATVTDNNGCSYQFNQTIGSFPQVAASITSSSGSFGICSGSSINLNAISTSGTAPFTYLWNNGATTSSISVSNAGIFTVTITDNNGCTASSSQQTTTLLLPQFTIAAPPNTHLCQPNSTPVTLSISNISGAPGPYSYSWSAPGGSGNTLDVIYGGTYSVTVTSSNGCTNSASTLIPSSFPIATFNGPNLACDPSPIYTCPVSYPTYNWTVTGGTYTQSNPSINVTWFNTSSSGIVSLQVVDQYGCTASSTVNVSGCCSTFTTLVSSQLGSSISNSNYSINGDLIVSQDLVITDCRLEMGANARIIVQDGVSLTITSASSTSNSQLYACQDMWQGIVLEGSGSSLLIENETLIKDAIIAVYSDHSPTIDISRSFFLNNYIGVQLESHNTFNNVTMAGNEFNTINLNKVPHVGDFSDAHVKLLDVKNKIIGNPNSGNVFKGRSDYGIFAGGSQFEAYDNLFENRTTNQLSSGIFAESTSDFKVSDNNFDGVNIGCYSYRYTNAEIGPNNNFVNVRYGIIASLCEKKVLDYFDNTFDNISGFGIINIDNKISTQIIKNNVFHNGGSKATAIVVSEIVAPTLKNGTFNIDGNSINNFEAGIDLSNLNAPQVKGGNSIVLKNAPIVNTFTQIGIAVKNCYRPIVKYNIVTSTPASPAVFIPNSRGIYINKSDQSLVACNTVSKIQRGIMWQNLSANSKMLGNEMSDCYDQLYLKDNPGLGDQYATIVVGQADYDVPADNKWLMATFNSHTFSEFSNDGIGTTFRVRSNGTPFVGISNLLLGPPPFSVLAYNNVNYSGPDFCASLAANRVNFEQEQAIAENIVYDNIKENENWQAKMYLYRELLSDTALLNSDSIMVDQKDSLESTKLGTFDAVANSLFSIITDTLMTNYQKENALIELAAMNSEIETEILVEDLEQQMNNFIIEKLSLDYIGISEDDRDFLESIASNCTQRGGNAVFVARTLLTLLDSINTPYNDSCPQQVSKVRNTAVDSINNVQVKVQPNPASEFVLISILGVNQTNNFNFEIINIDGKLMEEQISISVPKIIVNTSKYANGIYSVKVSIEGKTLTHKFLITH